MISVVIPVHNRKKFTQGCLESLYRQTAPPDQIIVIDDGSTDGTGEMLDQHFPDVVVLPGDGNLYWTAAINMGIRLALSSGADYVFTLNNDTMAAVDLLENMLEAAHERPTALIGALDVDAETKRPYYGGEILDWKWGTSKFLLDVLGEQDRKGLHEVSLFPARGLLIPRQVFGKIGLFDEKRLPHYMADYDFTLQARSHGFRVYCNYDAVLFTYPEEGGDHKIRKVKSWSNYMRHLFSIKGGGNLINFTRYTFRNCPPRNLMTALMAGYTRRLLGFWLK